MTDTRKRQFSEYRHIRPRDNHNGGVTFRMFVDQDTNTVVLSWARCSEKDRFNRDIGRKVADEAMDRNRVVVGTFLRCYDLADNAIVHVLSEYERLSKHDDLTPDLRQFRDELKDVAADAIVFRGIPMTSHLSPRLVRAVEDRYNEELADML